MADAKVTFQDKDRNEAAPGAEFSIWFKCPKRKDLDCGGLLILGRTNIKHDPQNQNGGNAHWNWDGNRDRPTLTPSVNCGRCWHGYIRNGRTVDCVGQDEPEPQ